jgi:hypothetical protein
MIRRVLTLVASLSIFTAWFVTLAVRTSVGAPPVDPHVRLGALPEGPSPLPPLVIPKRDPFKADEDVVRGRSSGLADKAAGRLASTDVPDIASVRGGGAQGAVGVMATIVDGDDAYALVEDGSDVRIAHVGDVLGASRIAAIRDKVVVLEDGEQISLDVQTQAGSDDGLAGAPAVAATPLPGGNPNEPNGVGPGARGFVMVPPPPVNAGPSMPAQPAEQGPDISAYGHTVLMNPNGTSAATPPPASTLMVPMGSGTFVTPMPFPTAGGLR